MTRCSTLMPAPTDLRQPCGTCAVATVRMLAAARLTAARTLGASVFACATHTRLGTSIVPVRPSRSRAYLLSAASPPFRTRSTMTAALISVALSRMRVADSNPATERRLVDVTILMGSKCTHEDHEGHEDVLGLHFVFFVNFVLPQTTILFKGYSTIP